MADGHPEAGGPAAVRVVVVDDQPLLRDAFAAMLDAEPGITVVGTGDDGAGALLLARRLRPDVLVMDIRMPRVDGIEATRLITALPELATTRVLILSTFGLDEYVAAALHAGASGFLLKDGPSEDLVRAIRSVAAGEAVLSPQVTRRLIDSFGHLLGRARPAPPALSRLTPRERQVLGLVAAGLTNAELARELRVGERTVKTHIGAIFAKLGLRDRVQAVIFAYEHGLVAGRTPPR
ncbi:response regulator [Micromonospora humidisoli]|uniref:Response regulator transcription factor n=1 Tax=Micromonospora humidisoli TaxID=2807622 RepID=A0ABS2JF55_9ACTN|nr:response regulator transcription factor [Micromonospora humidisoli]MBM7085155.1 response regulator transcription factor [Micromonospora humidisoli]